MRPLGSFIVLASLAALLLSCGPRDGVKTITKTRVLSSPPASGPFVASSAQRFGYQTAQSDTTPVRREGALTWDVPSTWKEKPASGMRLADFTAGPADEVECYAIALNGDGGGAAANINRWREQMGLDALSDEAVAALPRLDMLGRTATLVQMTGEYTGMPRQPSSGFMMVGVVCLLDDSSLFVKMTGPEAAVRAELDRFKAFCGSFRFSEEAAP